MLSFGGQHDNEYTLRGLVWADNDWLFSDNREKLICMVNDIIEELLDLDMEPTLASLWWTSTHQHEDMETLRVGAEAESGICQSGICHSVRISMYWVTVFIRDGKGFQRRRPHRVQGIDKLVARQVHLPFQDSPHENQV